MAGAMGAGPKSFCETKVQCLAERSTAFRAKQRVVSPNLRALCVFGLRDNVVITCHERGHFICHKLLRTSVQTFHPSQFVVVFWSRNRVAVGQVKSTNANRDVTHHSGFNPAGLFVGIVTGQTACNVLKREFGQDCDAVKTLLAVGFDSIAKIFDHFARETFVDGFNFLEQRHVWRTFDQPFGQRIDPGFDTVNIERCDFHGLAPDCLTSLLKRSDGKGKGVTWKRKCHIRKMTLHLGFQ